MTDKPADPVSIQWIRDEIEKNAEQAIQALEGYFEHSDYASFETAKAALHQIYGTLQIVELYPPSTLAHELEKTLQYLLEQNSTLSDEHISKIIQCITLIVRYIDGVLRYDSLLEPQDLVPPLNILREIRNERIVEPLPDLKKYFENQDFVNEQENRRSIQALCIKLLKLFQYSYLRFGEGQEQDNNLKYMTQAIERFSRLFPQKNLTPLWNVAIGVCQSLLIDKQYLNANHLNEFFGKLTHLLKLFSSPKATEIESRILTTLFLQGLEILQTLDKTTQSAGLILRHHKDKIDKQNQTSVFERKTVNNSTLSALSDALIEEISYIKDALDIFARSKEASHSDLIVLYNKLKQLSDSMILIQQLEIPRQSLDQQIVKLDKLITTSLPPSEDWLIDLATSLLFVESSAIGIKQKSKKEYTPGQTSEEILIDARKTLLREILVDLSKIKSIFVECVSAVWDLDGIKEIRYMLHQIESRLLYIDEQKAMSLLEKMNQYITYDLLHRSEAPVWHDIEEFADIVASLDQYIYLRIDIKDQSPKLIDKALERLDTLFTISDEMKASRVDEINLQQLELETAASLEPDNKAPREAQSLTEREEQDDGDEEIREIFREELLEITEELKPLIQKLSQNQQDLQVLSHLRRLIHTVKGSGRMAQLPLISEPAWALESLFNNLIEKNKTPNLQLLHYIGEFVGNMNKMASAPYSEEIYALSDRYTEIFKHSDSIDTKSDEAEGGFTRTDDDRQNFVQQRLEDSESDVAAAPESDDELQDELFTEMQSQEINGHLLVINNYIHVNKDFIDNAPQDESLLRAMHTLKAIFRCSSNEKLGENFVWFEESVRQLMKHELHRQESFFDALQICSDLVSGIVHQVDELDILIDALAATNIKLKNLIDESITSESPYEEWLKNNAEIFDILIRNTLLTSDPGEINEELQLFRDGAVTAQEFELTDFAHLLYNFTQFIEAYLNLDHDDKPSFTPLAMQLQESLLTIGDNIALGQVSINPAPLLSLSSEYLDKLNNYIDSKKSLFQTESDSLQELESTASDRENEHDEHEITENSESDEINEEEAQEILEIFKIETLDILESIDFQLNRLINSKGTLNHLQELQRDYHTIKGSSHFIHEEFIAALANEADLICERFLDAHQQLAPNALSILVFTQNLLRDRLEKLPNTHSLSETEQKVIRDLQETQPAPIQKKEQVTEVDIQELKTEVVEGEQEELEADDDEQISHVKTTAIGASDDVFLQYSLKDLHSSLAGKDNEIIEIFLEEADELFEALEDINAFLESAENEDSIEDLLSKTLRIIHTLKGGSRLAGITVMGDTAHKLEKILEQTTPDSFIQHLPRLKLFAQNAKNLVNDVRDWLSIQTNDPDIQTHAANEIETDPVVEPQHSVSESFSQDMVESLPEQEVISLQENELEPILEEAEVHSEHNPNALSPTSSQEADSLEDYDPEILEIFYEESIELVEDLEKTVGLINDSSIDESSMDQLKRILHTIKGSARLAGFAAFGNQAHLFESHLEVLRTPTKPEETRQVISLHDDLYRSLQKILESIKNFLHKELPGPQDTAVTATISKTAQAPAKSKQAKRRKASNEVVRIGADLMERLVNLAGETVIARSSVQQELMGFNRIIDEFGITLDRIREQIRHFETETENRMMSNSYARQIQSTIGLGLEEYQDFDTLEMDRFSSFHHLARALSESASDLIDMRDTMIDKVRVTETLVLQQSRVQTQLHEGLMLSRMVPFSRLAPRLTRMVRQIAEELGKKAELQIINAEGQMDRSVLERMIPPLEHMLRNALDHGIETPDIRQQKGKSVIGKIMLHLFREGNEIVLRLSDDGAGIDVSKVRKKAIENNLLSPDSSLSEKEILQFIFKPGFSTATHVTQISGRGVGMDVVFSEIKQLNGTLKLHAAPDVGTQFTIRLPFTVSMSRALLVRVADENYAIPLTYIEGVVRVSPYELSSIYESKDRVFSYAGKNYEVNYLGDYLQTKKADPHVHDSVPLLLARNTERSVAVQVDTLVGSKEIIIKNPGVQLSQVTGLSGATIIGDGSVILILDLNSLIRDDVAKLKRFSNELQDLNVKQRITESMNPLIMVVDDSVTVRKVTSRLLERHGIDAVTAKDGIDAVTQLRDTKPDLILLDIEMPRMDGFEVASHIRHDPGLMDIPIIMISSRTGEKHRKRAEALGVNEFLGKPYQEIELIQLINDLV